MFRPTDSFWADPRLATGVALFEVVRQRGAKA
jgi:hypothetical protein